MSEGWKCPVCNRGVSPNEKHCDHGQEQHIHMPVYIPYQPTTAPMWPYWPYEVTCVTGGTSSDGTQWMTWN